MKKFILKLKRKIKRIFPKNTVRYIQSFLSLLRNPKYSISEHLLFKNVSIVKVKNKVEYDIIIDPSNGFVDKQIFFYKDFEPEVKDIFLKYVKKGSTVLDIGANIGAHTLFLSKIVDDTGKVISFEPIKKIYEQLRKSIAINDFKNITLNNFALEDKEFETKINIVGENMGGSSIYKDKSIDFDFIAEENIRVKILDNLDLPKINFIKMDVEGYEWNVIKGAKKLLERDRPNIIFEYNPLTYDKELEGDSIKILEYLKSLNYKLFDINDINNEITDFSSYRNSFTDYFKSQSNILAINNSY